MSQRVKELMPLAYDLVRKRHNGYFDQDLLLQYMAELVIKECANSLTKLDSSVFAEFDRHDAAKHVLNHWSK